MSNVDDNPNVIRRVHPAEVDVLEEVVHRLERIEEVLRRILRELEGRR